MVLINILKHSDMESLFDWFTTLEGLRLFTLAERVQEADAEFILQDNIRQCIHRHVLPPTVIGQGKGRRHIGIENE